MVNPRIRQTRVGRLARRLSGVARLTLQAGILAAILLVAIRLMVLYEDRVATLTRRNVRSRMAPGKAREN